MKTLKQHQTCVILLYIIALEIVPNYVNVYAFVSVPSVTCSNRASDGPGYDCVADCKQRFRLLVYIALRIVIFFLEELQLSGRVEDLD